MQLEENYEKKIFTAFAYPAAIPKSAWLIVYYSCLRITRVVVNKYPGLNTFAVAFRNTHTYSTTHGNCYNFTDEHSCAYRYLNFDAYPYSKVYSGPTTSEGLRPGFTEA